MVFQMYIIKSARFQFLDKKQENPTKNFNLKE